MKKKRIARAKRITNQQVIDFMGKVVLLMNQVVAQMIKPKKWWQKLLRL